VPCDVLILGERAGEEESRRGYPFCGKSGKELDRYLLEGGIHRDDVYCTNLCKDFLKGNPDPTPDEIRRDEHFLIEELKTVRPKYIGLVGRFAARYFLGGDLEMDWSHGLPFVSSQGRFRMMPLYHPAFGLHSASMTPLVWSDFQAFCRMVRGASGSADHLIDTCPDPQYMLLTDYSRELFSLIFHGRKNPTLIYMDTEGSAEKPWGLSFTFGIGEGYVVLASDKEWLSAIADYVKWNGVTVVLHNAFHDIAVLRSMGIEGFRFTDTMVKAYHLCLFPQGLKPLSRRLCGMVQDDYEDVIGEADKEKKIQWLIEVHNWVSNHWPEESKTPLSQKIRKGSGRRLERTSQTVARTLKPLGARSRPQL